MTATGPDPACRPSDLLAVVSTDGRLGRLGDGWHRVLGWEPDDVAGRAFLDLVHPDDLDRTRAAITELAGGAVGIRLENRCRTRDGRHRSIDWTAVAVDGAVHLVGSDVTEARREAHLSRLVEEVSHVGSWEIDLVTDEVRWSRVTHELHGTDPDDHAPTVESFLAFHPPAVRSTLEKAVTALATRGQRFDLELPMDRSDGSRIWVRISARADVRDGEVLAAYGTFEDVTAEREERLHLERFEEMIELGSDGVWELAADGTTLYVNERMAAMLETRPEQMIGRSALEHFTGRWREAVATWFAGVDASTVDTNRLRLTTASGRPLWANVSIRSRADADGRVSAVTAMVSDLTDLQAAEDELRGREARLRAFVQLVPLAICVTGHPDGAFLDANEAFIELVGLDLETVRKLSIDDLLPDRRTVRQLLQQTVATGGRYGPVEIDLRHPVGEMRTISLQGIVLDEDGRQAAWTVLQDVTEQRRLDRLQDEFVATVSHELRTPMTSIHAALSLLGRDGLDPARRGQLLEVATRNSDRLRVLVDDILDLERLGSGSSAATRVELDLRDVATSAAEAASAAAAAERVTLRVDAPDPVRVLGDEHRLLQLAGNLLSNAVRFAPPGTEVTVRVRRSGDRALLTVRDRGPGIPSSFRPRLFERFAQADASDRRRPGGTGLGLSIVRAIAEQHGGEVREVPPSDGGACFQVDLPTSDRGVDRADERG